MRKKKGVGHKEGVETFCIISLVIGKMLGLAPKIRANVIMGWVEFSMQTGI